jgi:hypothetical protein
MTQKFRSSASRPRYVCEVITLVIVYHCKFTRRNSMTHKSLIWNEVVDGPKVFVCLILYLLSNMRIV